MRTAARKDVVAFKTFLRTLIHELCHHLDYELYKLPETFHTEGFYKRESTLVNALLRRRARCDAGRATPLEPDGPRDRVARRWGRIAALPEERCNRTAVAPRPARLGVSTLATALVEPCPRTG